MILNIGCGHLNRSQGEIGFDLNPGCNPDVCGDCERLPFKDNAFDGVVAVHVLEHIRNLVNVMDECYRVTAPGGRFNIRVPIFPSPGSIADPTHVRYFIPDSFDYFVREGALPSLKNRWEMGGIRTTPEEIYVTLRKA